MNVVKIHAQLYKVNAIRCTVSQSFGRVPKVSAFKEK